MNRLSTDAIVARVLIGILSAMTLLPFVSMFTAALAPSGTYPPGLSWPAARARL